MQVETLKDVLEWTRGFHKELAACLHQGAAGSESDRAKLLLDYLAQHEKNLSELVYQFEESAELKALDTWCYDYLEKNPILHKGHSDVPFRSLDPDEIMDVIIDQHEQVIDLYRYLHAKADTESTRELTENLRSLEEHEAMKLTQAANRLQDM